METIDRRAHLFSIQRENASLRTRLTTYEEDDGERVRMEEEMRRAKRVSYISKRAVHAVLCKFRRVLESLL